MKWNKKWLWSFILFAACSLAHSQCTIAIYDDMFGKDGDPIIYSFSEVGDDGKDKNIWHSDGKGIVNIPIDSMERNIQLKLRFTKEIVKNMYKRQLLKEGEKVEGTWVGDDVFYSVGKLCAKAANEFTVPDLERGTKGR